MKRKIFSILFALVLIVSLGLTMTVPALAAGSATFSPDSGPVGTSAPVSGSGWAGSEAISSVTVGGVKATYSLTVTNNGILSGKITIPAVAVVAKDISISGAISGSQTIPNAYTVANYWPIIGIAIALILLIGMIVVLARRGARSRY